LALIQCTSPFVSKIYLRKAIEEFKWKSCVFSVFRSFKLRWFYDENTRKVRPINFNFRKRPRRQDWKGELIEAGMFYFSKRNILDRNLFQDDSCGVVEILAEDSMEIDTPTDLELARILFQMRRRKITNVH
jgi:N-acylneuraminate/3-deoxy-D-glycero-D-galacto-nononate cytidylyltransferase